MSERHYQIMGADGQDYGPVNAQQIRAWIAEERLEEKTPVKPDGAQDWVFLGSLPEFQGVFKKPTRPSLAKSWVGKVLLLVVLILVAGIIYLALREFNPH